VQPVEHYERFVVGSQAVQILRARERVLARRCSGAFQTGKKYQDQEGSGT
jgi:hypothetical protein